MRSEVLFIGGRSGAGKSSVAFELHAQLAALNIKHCVIEGDSLDLAFPHPWEHNLAEQNLAAIWANYRALGYMRMIYTNTGSVRFTQELAAAMGDEPSASVAALGAGWVSFDAGTGKAECINFPQDYPSVSTEAFLEVYQDHPLVVSYLGSTGADPGIRRISDLVSDLQLRRRKTYQEAFRPLGIDRQFSMLTAKPGPTSMRAWALVRIRQDFSDRELETARHVQTMLRVLDRAQRDSGGTPPARGEQYSLTAREQEIMRLMGRGLTTWAIGHLLGVSPRTVAKHLEHAYAKLGCTNRIDALRILTGP